MTRKRKIKLVVSDFHLGRGKHLPDGRFNYLEDFFLDDRFVEFLRYHGEGEFAEADVELICNGDFFNLLQTDPCDPAPDILTEAVALRRLQDILSGHPELFEALRRFNGVPGRRVTFVMGNHDPGLLFPKVQERLRELFGTMTQVILGAYVFDGVHVEHGNQYCADNAYDTKRYFLTSGLSEPVVNLPWGGFFVIHLLNKVKKERPYFDKIYPFRFYFRWALIFDTAFAIRSLARIFFYFFWIRFRKDPHRRSSIIQTLKILKEVPISPRLDRYAKKILLTRPVRIVVFGHTHYALRREFAHDKHYLNTGLWNEQVSLDIAKAGRHVILSYVHLEYDAQGRPQPSLKEWKGGWKPVEELY